MLRLSELKSVVLGFGVLNNGRYFVPVHAFVRCGLDWEEASVLSGICLSFEQRFKHKLAGFIFP